MTKKLNLRRERLKHKLTQEQLGDAVGYCRKQVIRHEKDGVPKRAENVYRYFFENHKIDVDV